MNVDLSMPDGTEVDLDVGDGEFVVVRHGPFSASCRGTLVQGGGFAGDLLEGFITALAADGFPVHAQDFKRCLGGYLSGAVLEKIQDQILPEDRERWERGMSERALRLHPVYDGLSGDTVWRVQGAVSNPDGSIRWGFRADSFPGFPYTKDRDVALAHVGAFLDEWAEKADEDP